MPASREGANTAMSLRADHGLTLVDILDQVGKLMVEALLFDRPV